MESNARATYEIKVLPLVKTMEIEKKGKKYITKIDVLTSKEMKDMSCEPRMLLRNGDDSYSCVAQLPPVYKGTGIKWTLFYLAADLTEEEVIKYADRFITITVTVPEVVNKVEHKKVRERKMTKRTSE